MSTFKPLSLVTLGRLFVTSADGTLDHLSAASGIVYSRGRNLYVVGDDQASVAEFSFDQHQLHEALRAGQDVDILPTGIAQRIIQDFLPDGEVKVNKFKADFEALTIILPRHIETLPDSDVKAETLRRFPHGLMLISGSGGLRKGKRKRSKAIVYSLDEHGHIVGLPSKVSFEELHEHLDTEHVIGKLNIEGICVYEDQLVLAQRGNSLDDQGNAAPSMLIRLSLLEFLRSLYTDLSIGACEVTRVDEYRLGTIQLMQDGVGYQVDLAFTDIDAVAHDPQGRLVFTAAAEALQPEIDGLIAGSIVGVIDRQGAVEATYGFDRVIKLEGVDARYNPSTGLIDVLLVPDPDDPEVAATLYGGRLG